MADALTRLLARIEPIPADTDRRVDSALNAFSLPSALITDRSSYSRLMAAFYHHMECRLVGAPTHRGPDVEFDYGRCRLILQQEYGQNGDKAAFELARTGHEGGLRGLLGTIAEAMGKEHVSQLVETCVAQYWESRSVADLLSDAEEYVRRFGRIIPAEMRERGGVRIRGEFFRALTKHPFVVAKIRQHARI